jgi:hypothetical protein
MRFLGSTRFSMDVLPIEVFLLGATGFVLPSVRSVVGHVSVPMLLAKQTMFFFATSLGNPFIKGYHFTLGRVAWFSATLRPFMILIGQKGFFDAFQGFKEFPDTLWDCGSIELILVMTSPRDHPEDVTC